MYRHTIRRALTAVLVGTVLIATTLLAASCGGDDGSGVAAPGDDAAASVVEVDPDGVTTVEPGVLDDELDALPTGTLTPEEIAGLQFMREEEKLARDVYLTLGEEYGLTVFANIADAEQTHMDAVATLLERHGIDDPAAGRDIGEFTDTRLQAMYDSLVATGSTSEIAALEVGALIEETDIVDLRARASTTADIALVYDNLERGSRNHLRAFSRTLARMGVSYEPAVLDDTEYLAIVGGSVETGSTASGRGRGRG